MKKQTVGIFTTFQDFHPGYSLTGIAYEQALMLVLKGHEVHLFVNEQYNPKHDQRIKDLSEAYPDRFQVHKKTKFMHLTDYQTSKNLSAEHKEQGKEAGATYAEMIKSLGIKYVFTHDFIFTGWNLPYAIAVKEASELLKKNDLDIGWYHWVHSVPTAGRDWWNLNWYGTDNHWVVYPNRTEINRVHESFQTSASNVKTIPHLKDIRVWYDFGEDSMKFTFDHPHVMDAKVLQVYPCSTDRLSAKQLHLVMKVFSYIKKAGTSVCLIAANQWATGRQPKQNIQQYIDLAKNLNLEYGKEFIFTSEVDKKYELGIDRKMLRELQLLQSVFVFPTREESFGLVGPEAAFSGCLFVINRSLTMQFEVMGYNCPGYEFGSHHQNAPAVEEENYINAVALAILGRINQDEAVMTKMHCRRRYNLDAIYRDYYQTILI